MRITYLILIICFLIGGSAVAQQSKSKNQTPASDFTNGNRYFATARYDSAIYYYTRSIGNNNADTQSLYNRSICYLKYGNTRAAIADLTRFIELQPDNKNAISQRAAVYQELGQYGQAILDYEKALDGTSDATWYNNRGMCYKKLGNNERALVDFSVAISKAQTDTQYYVNRAAVYLDMGNPTAARRDLSRCIEIGGRSKEVYFSRAICCENLKNFKDAIVDYSTAIGIDSGYVQAFRNRAACYYTIGDYQMASLDFAQVLSKGPTYNDGYNAGLCYENLNLMDFASKAFTQALELKANDIDALFHRGDCYVRLKLPDPAIADFSAIIAIDNRNFNAYCQRAEAYRMKGAFDLALTDYDKALSMQPNNQSLADARAKCAENIKRALPVNVHAVINISAQQANDPQAYFNRGKYYESVFNENAALRDYNQAIRLNPGYADAYQRRALLRLKRVEDHDALGDLSKLISLHVSDPMIYYDRGLLLEKTGDLDNAITDFTSAIELKEHFPSAYYRRAIVFYKVNNLAASIRDFSIVLQSTGPRDSECWFRRGVAYYDQGSYDAAISDFNEVLKLRSDEQTIILQKLAYIAENKFNEAGALPDVTVNSESYFSDKFFNFLTGYIRICEINLSVDNYGDALIELLKLVNNAHIETFNDRKSALVTPTNRNIAIQYANVLAKTGWVYEKLGAYQKAVEYYQKAMVIDSNAQNVKQRLFNAVKAGSRVVSRSGPEIRLLVPQREPLAYVNRDGTIYVSGTATSPNGIRSVRVNDSFPYVSGSGFFQTTVSDQATSIDIEAIDYNGSSSVLHFHIEKKIPLSDKSDSIPQLPDKEKFHAVLIACSQYKSTRWPSLSTTLGEAEAFRKVLIDKYDFDRTSVDTIYNKSRAEILGILSNKIQRLTNQDNLVIFFSGHGYYKPSSNTAFWVPSDADNEYDYISNDDINKLLTGTSARHVLVMADACFSGALRSGVDVPNKYEYQFSSRQLLTSGGIEAVPGTSIFMRMILGTLGNNHEPYLSVRALYGLIFNGIRNQTGNEPLLRDLQVYGSEGGQFYFKRDQKTIE